MHYFLDYNSTQLALTDSTREPRVIRILIFQNNLNILLLPPQCYFKKGTSNSRSILWYIKELRSQNKVVQKHSCYVILKNFAVVSDIIVYHFKFNSTCSKQFTFPGTVANPCRIGRGHEFEINSNCSTSDSLGWQICLIIQRQNYKKTTLIWENSSAIAIRFMICSSFICEEKITGPSVSFNISIVSKRM